eukprot:maker-scaffold846_size89341-snap-gene-0.10 protein:Tk05677 transcript:maker-scaffold846_size89341-snap-gene-0.10-mRNA-1 annotation:"peptidase u61 ld-carboxypeptidase a"
MGRKFRLILAYLYILFHCPGHGLASSTVSQCRLFMAQAQKPKVEEKFLQNPSYFQSLDICEKVLSWQMPRLPPPTQVHRRKAISRPRASSTGLLSGHRKNYRRQIQEDQFDTECKIVFYTRSDFGGQHSTLRGSRRFIQEREKSLRTFGNCCWALFSVDTEGRDI